MKVTGAHRFLAAVAFAVLTACSNGRGSVSDPASGPVQQPPPTTPVPPPSPPPTDPPPTDPPPDPTPQPPPEPDPPPAPTAAAMAGYWKGTATEQRSNRTFTAVALIDAQGNAQWLLSRAGLLEDDGFVVFANVCCESQFEDDDLVGKELGANNTREAGISVEVAGGALSGELHFHRDDYRFALNAAAEYNRSVSLAALAGVYTRRESSILGEQVTLTVTIEANGQLTGSYSNGCVFNGNASIPDTSHNMVQLQIDLANCGSHGSSKQWNGAYTGLGLLLSGDDVFYHSVIGPTWLGPQTVER